MGELTYFSSTSYPTGSLLFVPFRKGEAQALVLSCEEVRLSKATLRTSSFALRKIRKQSHVSCLPPAYLEAGRKTALYHATTLGAVLFSCIPKILFTTPQTLDAYQKISYKSNTKANVSLYQAPYAMRVVFYRSLAREAFAKKSSVFFITPTQQDAERLHTVLREGIEQHTTLLHSGLTTRKQHTVVQEVLDATHPLVVVTTPHFLAIPRGDLGTMVLEQEQASPYTQHISPFIDFRIFAKELANTTGIQLVLADLPLRAECIFYKEKGVYQDIATGCQRMHMKVPIELIDMKKNTSLEQANDANTTPTRETLLQKKEPFKAVGKVLLKHIADALNMPEGRVFLHTTRKGFAPTTLCRDCETTVSCPVCVAPLVLHKGTHQNLFLCHACGMSYDAQTITCKTCGGWRLDAVGIGIERVAQELQIVFPSTPLFILSGDTTKTHAQAHAVVKRWYNTPQSILLGTELALPYVTESTLVGVVSLDSLLSLPRWNVYEHVASVLTRLQERAEKTCVVQTRHAQNTLFSDSMEGNFLRFQKNELAQREKLGYPPFGTLLKIGVSGALGKVYQEMQTVTNLVAPHPLILAEHPRALNETTFVLYGFIFLKQGMWPDEILAQKLATLPPPFSVKINPDSIL